jgi:hypothetical protein
VDLLNRRGDVERASLLLLMMRQLWLSLWMMWSMRRRRRRANGDGEIPHQ